MDITELAVLLPCHSLEDFPLYHDGDQAAELLTAWTALWHPALLAAGGKMPRWYRADFPPDESAGRVYLIPSVCDRLMAAGWTDRVEEEGATVVRAQVDLQATIDDLLSRVSPSAVQQASDLTDDFLAFGYAFLQIELLTRQMRYSSSIDEPHLDNQLVQAARAWEIGDDEASRGHLRKCFDVLMEARDRFYPVDAYLLDLVLTAPTMLGEGLRTELASSAPVNVQITGSVLEQLAQQEHATLAALRTALDAGTASIAGGDFEELETSLLPLNALEQNLDQAETAYQTLLGHPARVYMRRRFGLTPLLPLLLSRRGYIGCIHSTFDDGLFPSLGQSKTRWQGLDGSAIDVLGRIPLDARRPESFLAFSQKLAESMDFDHVATVSFIHWPAESSFWLSLLKRVHAYAPLFGKFVTVDHYFAETESSGRLDKFDADDYRAPYLQQAVAAGVADPLSCHVQRCVADVAQRADHTLATIDVLVHNRVPTGESGTIERLAHTITGKTGPGSGQIVFNPLTHDHLTRDLVRLKSDGTKTSIPIPGMGYIWTDLRQTQAESPPAKSRSRGKAADLHALANQHLQVQFDPATGGIRSLRDFRHRGNLLSQQLALRLPTEGGRSESWHAAEESAHYSQMVADEWDLPGSASDENSIAVRGRLQNQHEETQARFTERFTLLPSSRVVQIEIELDSLVDLPANPWNAYYASRFAWADESAELFRSLHQTRQRIKGKRIEAPHFVEIADEQLRLAILTGGLPYHRRADYRMLDTLLVVRGESRRNFRLAIGVDLPNIAGQAEALLLEKLPTASTAEPSALRSGWFFHLNAPNIIALDWSPLIQEEQIVGFRAKLLETAGQPGRVKLRAFKPLDRAMQIDAHDNPIVTLSVSEDTILIDFSVNELIELEAHWFSS